MTFLIALSTIPFSTSCKNIENKNMENTSLISNEMGGGGTPSIDEPDKAYPQPEPTETEYEDEPIAYSEAIDWSTRYDEEITRRKTENPAYVFSLSGSGTASDPYLISDEYDFYAIRKVYGKYYKLTNDIYLNYGKFVESEDTGEIEYFSRKDQDDKLYKWTKCQKTYDVIDGCGHSVFGLYTQQALFDFYSSKIMNFEIKNAYSTGNAILIGRMERPSLVENVNISGFNKSGSSPFCAQIDNYGEFKNCINYAKLINANQNSAGICATAGGGTFVNCVNYGIGIKRGGIVGSCNKNVEIINCINYKNITGSTTDVGGIVGHGIPSSGDFLSIKNCKNYGIVSTTSYGLGGIAGALDYGIAENCENFGMLKYAFSSRIGGIVGRGNPTITNCINHGTILASGDYAGGICGEGNPVEILNCKNYGNLRKTRNSSGILGSGNSTIIQCENYGECVCGIANSFSGTIYRCSNYGNATYGIVRELNNNGNIRETEISGKFTYYVGQTLNAGSTIKNCLIKGSAANSKGIASTNNATIDGVIFIGKINGVQKNQYYGSDFSAFFVKWKTGYIGLKALESAGVYMFAIPDEEYLKQIGYTKAG